MEQTEILRQMTRKKANFKLRMNMHKQLDFKNLKLPSLNSMLIKLDKKRVVSIRGTFK